jgi:predicted AlkP superfamily phosphohydrolase/phosphomutase/thioredoxin-like negative regulator of GroEL
MSTSTKVLLVGWDAADWRVINPLLSAGKLPNLEHLIATGVSGNMAALYPALSPMLWTSIATGKRPYKHGIHGFFEPDPHLGGVRPITNLSRKTKAIWNILSQNNKRCVVVGWWPSQPAEPLPKGVMVSNAYQKSPNADTKQPWPMTMGTVHPATLAETLAKKRIRPSELDNSHILRFVPNADKIDRKKDRRPNTLVRIIADCTNIHSAAMHLIDNEPWDFMAVYYDAIDHFGHGFMRYHPPRQKWIPKKDFELYNGVIEAGYRYHDMMLGELLVAAGPDTTVLLMSDHGFHPDKLRPTSIPIEPAGPAVEHRHYGIFVLKGSDIKMGERILGANVLDVCPTLLSLFDLPVGQDMDGKPLVTAWVHPPEIEAIPSWDAVYGPDGTHPPDTRLSPDDSREALRQLEALGYIDPLPENAEQAVNKARCELRYNLACAYIDAHMLGTAAEIFAELWSEYPEGHRHGAKLLTCQLLLGRYAEARATFELLRISRRKDSNRAKDELKELLDKLKTRKPKELKANEQKELDRLTGRAKLSPVPMQQIEIHLLLGEDKPEKALLILEKLRNINQSDPNFHTQSGRVYIALKRWDEAQKSYRKALELDSDNAQAHFGLAQVYLAIRRNYEAVDHALTAIGLLYHNPSAHFLLGVALHRLGQIDRAIEALRVCVTQNANFLLAHRRLAHIYENRLRNSTKAAEHRAKFREGIARLRTQHLASSTQLLAITPNGGALPPAVDSAEPVLKMEKMEFDPTSLSSARGDASFVTIVSGLPRSGTSLMMQMLASGGLYPLHDNHRSADADNPRGYFEFALAKNIRMDDSWMPHARGRALKLIAQLLPFLPPNHEYRIILMERSLEEVLASQKVMLDRHGRKGAALSSEKLRAVYGEQLLRVTEVLEKRKLPVLRVSHHEAISDPVDLAKRVADFLGLPLDLAAMAAAIDPSLHRQRSSS